MAALSRTWQQGWPLSHIPGSCSHRVFVKCGLHCRQARMHHAAMHWARRVVVLLKGRLKTTVSCALLARGLKQDTQPAQLEKADRCSS